MAKLIDLQKRYLINIEQNYDFLKKPLIKYEASNQNLQKPQEPKIITFYAEKGGVGKTTICITLAHTFARAGKRIVIYDCDVQRSLTAWAFGLNIELSSDNKSADKLESFLKKTSNKLKPADFERTLYNQVDDNGEKVKPAFAIYLAENLYIVPGDRDLPTLDSTIINAEAISNSEVFGIFPNQKSARAYYSIMETAKFYEADYVFLDLNPYPGVLNRCLIMSSHYVIIPTCLDFFCLEMMHMMQKNLSTWEKTIETIQKSTKRPGAWFPWPDHRPKFLGYILNMLMVYNKPSEEFNFQDAKIRNNMKYFEKMIDKEAKELTKNLGDNRNRKTILAIKTEQYQACNLSQNLGKVTQYHGLADISNLFHTPVPFLEETQFVKRDSKDDNNDLFRKETGVGLADMRERVHRFRGTYEEIARRVCTLIENENRSENADKEETNKKRQRLN